MFAMIKNALHDSYYILLQNCSYLIEKGNSQHIWLNSSDFHCIISIS